LSTLGDRLQGAWGFQALEVEGNAMPSAMIAAAQIVMDGDRFTTSGMGGVYSGTFTVDELADPQEIDLRFADGEHAGRVSPGILKLDDACLTICLALAGGTRPVSFSTAPGSGHALEVLRRSAGVRSGAAALAAGEPDSATASDVGAETPEMSGDLAALQGEWTMLRGRMDGQDLDRRFAATGSRVVEGSRVTVTFGGTTFLSARFTIDPSTEPKSMDFAIVAGPQAGATMAGIYRIDGEILHVCYGSQGNTRPTEFAAEPGDGQTYGVWRRATA